MDDADQSINNTELPTQPYLTMTNEELIKHYQPSLWSARALSPDDIIARHVSAVEQGTKKARSSAPFLLDVSYGDTENQKLDMLDLNNLPKGCPVFIFIHGGYWQLLGREFSAYMTLPIYEAGGAVVVIGYDLAPHVSLPEIINQVKKAVAFVLDIAGKQGSRGVYLCGHSAGGHLAAMILTIDWMSEFHLSPSLIKGAALISGVFDVRPLVKTPENDALKLDNDTAWKCSPFNYIKDVVTNFKHIEILIVVGSEESPEFIRQSKEYYKMLMSQDMNCNYLEVEGEDHFTLMEKLDKPDYVLSQKLLSLMKLKD